MKPVQYFSDHYLSHCRTLSADHIVEFLEAFRLMQQPADKSKLISIKIPESLLTAFRKKCEIENLKYQTQIKALMKEWV
jgi:predicted DNA binding CopG/RHH family protein